ncbi:MAG: two-component system, cell cycle response regulator, partial [Humisphaera sp.]|nr:two-component system, cell cycle response regulator [Humisphaera sp.]
MSRVPLENVLVIGDDDRQVQGALAQALPNANVTAVASVFDGIAEMTANRYTTVIAAAEPIERRPEAAVKTLRQLAHTIGKVATLEDRHVRLQKLAIT